MAAMGLKVLIALFCLSTPAYGADIKWHGPDRHGNITAVIWGEILEGDETKFSKLVAGKKDLVVRLDSKGGWNRPASLIGHLMRSLGHEATVEKGARCDSACTLIFFAGTYRTMDPGTRLGFHSAWPEGSPVTRDEHANKKVGEYLAWMGAPQQVIDFQPKADPCCLNYLSQKELKAMGALKERESPSVVMDRTPELLGNPPPARRVSR
jgi:hypothetical protein